MSVSLYRWTPSCDGDYCPGDCDLCSKNTDERYCYNCIHKIGGECESWECEYINRCDALEAYLEK